MAKRQNQWLLFCAWIKTASEDEVVEAVKREMRRPSNTYVLPRLVKRRNALRSRREQAAAQERIREVLGA